MSLKIINFMETPFEVNDFVSHGGVKDYMKSITSFKPRDYQIDAVYDA